MTTAYNKSTFRSFTGTRVSSVNGVSTSFAYPYTWTDSLNGVRLPDWRKRIRNMQDATTDMTATEMTVTHVDGHLERRSRNIVSGTVFHRSERGYIRPDFDPPSGAASSVSTSEASRDASSMFYQRARAAQSHLLSGVAAGELRETLEMIKGRGRKMGALFPVWRNRLSRRRSGRSALQNAADAYLEFQFGWRPLASDIRGALAALKEDRFKVVPISVFAKRDTHVGSTYVSSAGTQPVNYAYQGVETSMGGVKIRGGIKLREPGHGRNLQKLGLLPTDFLVTAYELLPWSFLVDYFTDLGGVLNALSFPTSSIAWASTTGLQYRTATWSIIGLNKLPAGLEELPGAISIPQVTVWRKKQVTRRRGQPQLPTLTARLPKSLWQWANILALGITRNYRHLRI